MPSEVNQDRLVDLFLSLVRQNTPPRSERDASKLPGAGSKQSGSRANGTMLAIGSAAVM